MLIGSAAAVVTVTLLAITALDKPFTGSGRLEPVAMERTLDLLDQARQRHWRHEPSHRATTTASRS